MRVLGIFAKQPVPGQVKTRIAQGSSPDWAGRLAAALLADSLDRLAAVAARRVIAFAPASAVAWFGAAGRGRFELVAQADGDLGQRLRHFIEQELARGADAVVVLGADSPTLPVALVEQAFEQLATADLVLGPTCDGGYYLIGCGRRVPPVFE